MHRKCATLLWQENMQIMYNKNKTKMQIMYKKLVHLFSHPLTNITHMTHTHTLSQLSLPPYAYTHPYPCTCICSHQ
jgi:hypothetical protein